MMNMTKHVIKYVLPLALISAAFAVPYSEPKLSDTVDKVMRAQTIEVQAANEEEVSDFSSQDKIEFKKDPIKPKKGIKKVDYQGEWCLGYCD